MKSAAGRFRRSIVAFRRSPPWFQPQAVPLLLGAYLKAIPRHLPGHLRASAQQLPKFPRRYASRNLASCRPEQKRRLRIQAHCALPARACGATQQAPGAARLRRRKPGSFGLRFAKTRHVCLLRDCWFRRFSPRSTADGADRSWSGLRSRGRSLQSTRWPRADSRETRAARCISAWSS